MKIVPDSYHIVIMRSSGGGAPITVPTRWVKRLWISFLVMLALLVVLSLALGFTVQRLKRSQATLKARQTEVNELYISLARQNEQLISLKKLVPPASALYLASLDKPAGAAPAASDAVPMPAAPSASPAASPAAAPEAGPLTKPTMRPAPAPVQPTSKPQLPAAEPVKPQPKTELVNITDLKHESDQLSLCLKRASGEIASGYLVAVFRASGTSASYPELALKGGTPVDGRQGLNFNVRNYRLISFKPPLSDWTGLSFFVYDRQGRLKQRLSFSREQVRK